MNLKKKMLKVRLLLFIMLIYGCSKDKKNDTNEDKILIIKNDKILLDGTIDSTKTPTKFWNFYNQDEVPFLNIVFYKNSTTDFGYQIKQKNSLGRIVYSADVKNGVIYNEYDSESLQTVNLSNGDFLYKNYCYSCHNPKRETIGSSMLKMKKIPIDYFSKLFELENTHKTIPEIKKNELKSIHLYINN